MSEANQVTQQDGIPVHWIRPFSTWQQNEELLDVYTLSAPDGTDLNQMWLQIGLYQPDTGARIPVSTRSGERPSDDAVVIPVRDVLSSANAQPAT